MKDSEHLQWIHDRLVNLHSVNENLDYMIRFRSIIATMKHQEESFEAYLKFVEQKRKTQNEKIEDQTDRA